MTNTAAWMVAISPWVLALCGAQAAVGPPVALAEVSPVMRCEALTGVDFSGVVGAPTRITAAQPLTQGKPAPYCRVLGTVASQVAFEVRLPLDRWTQRLVVTGCGGLCGQLRIQLNDDSGCLPATRGELALASTDMGHEGTPDGSWGADYAKRVDFAYRGMHVTTVLAKALLQRFYGRPARYAYFVGCSDGGREALIEAQRYPHDFNGIIAGAPAMNFTTQNTFYHAWNALQNTGPDGRAILTADKLPVLHAAVLAQCDAADGLKDGLISDPVHCHPDLQSVECHPGQDSTTCLSGAQVRVASEIYRGAHDAGGRQLVISGPLPGSELNWAGVYVPVAGQEQIFSRLIAEGTIRYLVSDPNPPARFELRDLQFDQDTFSALTRYHGLYDSTDPDLSAFAAAGGKLILYHGLADPHISPLNTVAYYEAVQRLMGAGAVERFARLFLFPGGGHCSGGQGPFDMDVLSVMLGWVERGTAPQVLIASHHLGDQRPGASPGRIDRTRPIYPYPLVAKYIGHGSIDAAANFVAAAPVRPWPTRFDWMGAGFYTPHYEVWCEGRGSHFDCQHPQ